MKRTIYRYAVRPVLLCLVNYLLRPVTVLVEDIAVEIGTTDALVGAAKLRRDLSELEQELQE